VLEDRQLLTSFLVVLGTDNGGPSGQKVTATSGDLRYCVEQADAAHTATSDSIGFSSKLTNKPHTIILNSANGPLVLSDSHPLTINGPTALTLSVSGGSHVEILDIASGTVTINNLGIVYGNASGADGGGIFNQGTLSLANCFLNHDSAYYGGAVFNYGGTIQLSKCTLSLDSAAGNGGAISNSSSFPQATVSLTNCNLNSDQALNVGGAIDNGAMMTLTNCTLSSDSTTAGGLGGSIFNEGTGTVTLTGCTLSKNTATDGGAIFDYGTATLMNCTLSSDVVNSYGGGLFVRSGTAALTNCTLNNNSASGAGVQGGAIFNTATLTLTNCTIANNSVSVSNYNPNGPVTAYGGGIDNMGTATLTNCTVAGNSVSAFNSGSGGINTYGGGIYNEPGSTLNLTNTIVATNTALTGPDLFNAGAIGVADHDLIGDGTDSGISNGGGNIVGTSANPINPQLGPLQNNGGPTQTIALLSGSPAIGHADNSKAPAKDQRGIVRIDEVGETTDIGAFEL
jgi:hypothetical protein